MRAREALLASDLFPRSAAGRHGAALPDPGRDRQRLGQLRRVPGTAAPRRPVAAARHADDDPRAVGEPRRDGSGPARLLPLPLHPDGAVGRPRLRGVHRRHRDRGGARPQRAAPGPVLGDPRRPRGAGQRGGRARHRPGGRGPQGPPAARPRVRRRHRPAADPGRRGSEVRTGRRAPVRGLAARGPAAPGRPAGPGPERCPPTAELTAEQQLSGTPRKSCGCCWPRWPGPGPSRSGRWAPTRRWPCCRTAPGCSSTTSPSCSRRSPTRRWTRSGKSWSPRWSPPPARRATCWSPARPRAARSCCPTRSSTATS